MTPTEVLRHEHEIILKMLDAGEKELVNINSTNKINGDTIEKLTDFIKNFADGCHHAKEEKLLFVKLEEKGMSADSGPVAVMLMEHAQGRQYLRGINENLKPALDGNQGAVEDLKRNLHGYIYLLRNHIAKENNVLFVMADQMLNDEEQITLFKAFEKVEKEEIGEKVHEYYHNLAKEITARYAV